MTEHITEDEIRQYETQGYWVTPVLFDASEIKEIRNAFTRIYANDLDEGNSWPFVEPVGTDNELGIKTALFSWRVNKVIRQYVQKPSLTMIAARLLRADKIRLWQDQAIWKPGTGDTRVNDGNIGFHQDFSYWQDSSTTNMISANIALQDVTADNGALRVFPGSHKGGLISGAGDFFNTDLNTLRSTYKPQHQLVDDDVLALKAGQVSFHHSLTVHGSGPNMMEEPRLVLAPAYMPDGTTYREEGQEPCPHSDFLGPDRKHGMPFDGSFFPVVN